MKTEIPHDENNPEIFQVVVNHEEQYALWPDGRPLPAGWQATGQSGPREPCLAWVRSVWTDMRPLSVRLASND